MQTIAIDDDPDYRALEAHIDAALAAKRHKKEIRKGSTSWVDTRITPADAAVKFKLCMFRDGIFFGAREELVVKLKISPAAVGSMVETVKPSTVEFRGEYVQNDAAGKRRIDSIIALFP